MIAEIAIGILLTAVQADTLAPAPDTAPPGESFEVRAPSEGRVRTLAAVGPEFWAGTPNGIVRYAAPSEETPAIREIGRVGPAEGLPGLYITSILPDSGRIWVGTEDGLAELTETGWVTRLHRKQHGLADNFVTALARRGSHLYWNQRLGHHATESVLRTIRLQRFLRGPPVQRDRRVRRGARRSDRRHARRRAAI